MTSAYTPVDAGNRGMSKENIVVRLALNFAVMLVALLGSCLVAGIVVATGQLIVFAWLEGGLRRFSVLDHVIQFALSSIGHAFLVFTATAGAVSIGFLINRMRSPSSMTVCVVVGGLYGFFGGLFLEEFSHRGDNELLRAAVWGSAGLIGGAVFSIIVRRIDQYRRKFAD